MSSLYFGLDIFCHFNATIPDCDAVFSVEFYRGGHTQLFFESAIATPQLEGSTSAIAIPQLFKECCSATAIPQSQFFSEVRNLGALLPQFLANFWHIFGVK
jgi:hypothetical protein